jgi:hypothetical protein
MSKLDLKKELKKFYSASAKQPEIVDVPEGKLVTIVGRGAPEGPSYQAAIGAIYSTVYTVKFKCKAEGKDFAVMPLEGLWWWDDPSITELADAPPRKEWNWKAMIRVPDFVNNEVFELSKEEVKKKKGITEVDKLKLETFHEGLSAQILHVGPYSEEGPTGKRLHDFIEKSGYGMRGIHHEIYLSDVRRVPPERLKTVLRQPIQKRDST